MIQILEYIMQHYTWFLGGTILILLAIIGYYADKTNFGQGKNAENDNQDKQRNIDNMRLRDVTSNNDNKDVNVLSHSLTDDNVEEMGQNQVSTIENQLNHQDNQFEETPDTLGLSIDSKSNAVNNESYLNGNTSITSEQNNSTGLTSNMVVVESVVSKDHKTDSLLNEDDFNKFTEEFNSILPEKELINTDLLSDIEDLELGKTQKLDLSDVPDLDDIELPKIKQLASEEQDIWKF